jgi:hypothetical protein
MGYFGELATVNFKKDAEGRDLFFPFGIFGRGRILPDSETARRLRANAALVAERTMFLTMACAAWTFVAITGLQLPAIYVGYAWLGLIAASFAASIGMWLYYFKITRDMTVSGERQTFAERRRAIRQITLAARRSRRKMIVGWLAITYAGVCAPWWLGMGPPDLANRGFVFGGLFGVAALICLAILLRMIASDRRRS